MGRLHQGRGIRSNWMTPVKARFRKGFRIGSRAAARDQPATRQPRPLVRQQIQAQMLDIERAGAVSDDGALIAAPLSVMLMDLKTSRLARNPTHRDSRVDVIGYALCHDRIITGK